MHLQLIQTQKLEKKATFFHSFFHAKSNLFLPKNSSFWPWIYLFLKLGLAALVYENKHGSVGFRLLVYDYFRHKEIKMSF